LGGDRLGEDGSGGDGSGKNKLVGDGLVRNGLVAKKVAADPPFNWFLYNVIRSYVLVEAWKRRPRNP
jgi:hypothetical protein